MSFSPTSAPQHSCGYVSCPCERIDCSTSLVMINRRSAGILLRGPEGFGQILLRAVGENRDDGATLETLRHVDGRGDRRARGNPREHSFLPREPANHAIGALGVDPQILVGERRI